VKGHKRAVNLGFGSREGLVGPGNPEIDSLYCTVQCWRT
jgi:hypothetical protein